MGFDWGGVIGAVGSLSSSYLGSKASKNAGKDATNAANAANQTQWNIYQDQVRRQQPFYDAGVAAQSRYMQLLGLSPTASTSTGSTGSTGSGQTGSSSAASNMTNGQYYLAAHPELKGTKWAKDEASLFQHFYKYGARSGAVWGPSANQMQSSTPSTSSAMTQQQAFDAFRNTPGYQFGLDQGMKAVQASAAARGGLNSGATLKALQRYGNDYADQQGYTPYMNRLSGLFGGAQTAASSMGQAGQNYAGAYGQNMNNASQARQQSTYNSANAWQQGLNSLGYFANQYGTNNGWWGG